MITFKKYVLIKEEIGISNKEKFDMWDKFQNKEISENDFLKAIDFKKTKPNTSIEIESQSDRSENFFCVNEWFQNKQLIHQKMWWDDGEMGENWRDYDSDGNLIRRWDNQGNETIRDSKINEKGELTKIKIRKENGVLIQKEITTYDKKVFGIESKMIYYYYEGKSGVEDETKWEYKYDDDNREIYRKETSILSNKTTETLTQYWDNDITKSLKVYVNGELKTDKEFKQSGVEALPTSVTDVAKKRADEYNKKYHGMFLHSASKYDLSKLNKIKEDGKKAEICVSTLRSNTVFQSGADRVVFVGFGNIRELYDYDSYSERDEDGSRYATKLTGGKFGENLYDIKRDKIDGYSEKYHYDEGFMDFSNAEVVAVFADRSVINNWVILNDGDVVYKRELPSIYAEYKKYGNNIKRLKVKSFREFIKNFNPNIKLIDLNKFNSLQNSEELMRLMYKIKDEIQDTELMSEPLHPYEESRTIPTFKEYILLKEYTREVMPEIYAALEAYDDPMVGVHFSRGINIKNEIRNKSNLTPHIGLHLKPSHHDPIGIYAFPKDYVLSGKLESNTGFSEFKYFYIVKPSSKARILNLSKLTEDGAAKLLDDMGLDPDYMNDESIYHNSGKTSVGHIFWGVLEDIRKHMSAKGNVSWNILFKDTGYNVLYDEGDGIIHHNEPTQIIYLESSAMEVLDQGEQDDSANKIYSFFIKNFTELRPEKTKKGLTLRSTDNSYTLYVYPPSNGQIEIRIYSEVDYRNKFDVRVNLKDLNEKFVDELKKIILDMNMPPREKEEKEVSHVLEKISKRFNVKLKSGKNGEMEIRQGYQDSDKDCVIIFRISAYNNKMYFNLSKKHPDNWSVEGYNVNYDFAANDEQTPEDIINIGLNGLKENMEKYYSDSRTYATLMAIKTIEFLKKRVFGL